MKKSIHLAVIFIAFVLGQAIQLFISAVAYNLYANRPVLWNVVGALISIAIVIISFVIIRMEAESGYHSPTAVMNHYARPPLDTDEEKIEFDKI